MAVLLLTAGNASAGDRVVLVHGLARGSGSMQPLADHLAEEGFEVHNLDYPSREAGPEALVEHLREAVRRCCPPNDGKLHFVTHSLGGILVRAYLKQDPPPQLGRAVLLAPPNRGSEVVDEWGETAWFRAAFGPTAANLGTGPESFPNRIGPANFEVGIIAANGSINPVGSAIIPGEDDGAVSLESTQLEGATDFLVVDTSHTFIMRDAGVAEQVAYFLRHGRFVHPEPTR